ncbi:polysaccharide biosynthesis/export family protein [Leucothrix mucor]|uniref:polysaccharide biosynthesis/export family protein n=1 Tax=Leucothrix mucor TaxID=45248 RepID=UPI0003B713D5|nr:polysaccharide biosynthesis/export family protein [Leucothrix mucor]
MNYKNLPKLLQKVISGVVLSSLCLSIQAADPQNSLTPEAFDEGIPDTESLRGLNRPFGASLFTGKFAAQGSNALDPDYILVPGDKVSLHIWGAVQADETSVIDAQGNLFLPEIGAVKVAGSPAKDLSSLVKGKLQGVYTQGVDVYVNLLTATPVSVFVTGPVLSPGQYAGIQTDSVLAYLHQAGGIDPNRGSYRNIRILRRNQTIGTVDLYAFLRWGQLPNIRFQNGDTILVAPQSSTVNVEGDVRGNYRFEFSRQEGSGRDLINIARPNSSVTNIALSGTRNQRPLSVYLPIGKFANTALRDGDTVRFVSDAQSGTIDISVEGSYLGNSYLAAKKGSRLKEVLDYIAISPDEADINNIFIRRKSVAEKQKINLQQSINRLERSVLTSPAKSDGEASIRQQEAALVSEFIKNARNIVPDGRVVVSENGQIANIRLEDGDVIVIPFRSDVITISGEVNIPQALVFASNATTRDYVARAGGFTERADARRIIIRKPNGQIIIDQGAVLAPGDELLIFPRVDTKSMQYAKDIITIIFQIAAASSAVGIL